MKHCIDCGAELATPLEEFGETGQERCQTDFLKYQWEAKDREMAGIPYEIARLKSEIESLKEDIEIAEDELSDFRIELLEKEERMSQIEKEYPDLFEEAEQLSQGELICH